MPGKNKSRPARRREESAPVFVVPTPAPKLRGSAAAMAKPSSSTSRWFRQTTYVSVLGVLLGALMVSLSLLSVNSLSGAPGPAPSGSERSLGDPAAPVEIVEWFDFQCPACRLSALSNEAEIRRLYVDTGKAHWVARDFAFLGPESLAAAEAARAAADQGKYWAYHDLLFQRQGAENSGAFSADNLRKFASQLGLDLAAFDAALDQGKYRQAVQAETSEGNKQGVEATPTFFVNGRKIRGVPPLQSFKAIIEEELAKKK